MTKTPEVTARAVGAKMSDGTIYAGITADGTAEIYAMPRDLVTQRGFKTHLRKDARMTFNEAAKIIEKLNADKAFGHDDWQIPSEENLRVVMASQSQGSLKGTFGAAARYLSSTEYSNPGSSYLEYGRMAVLANGEDGIIEDYSRGNCRAVRLVVAKP